MEKARTINLDWRKGSLEFLLITELCEQVFVGLGYGSFALFLNVCRHRLALNLGCTKGERKGRADKKPFSRMSGA